MPSGSSGGHSGGFGGGHSFHGGSGHYGSSHSSFGVRRPSSSSHGGSYHPYPVRPWYRPRVVVFGGRQVYLDAGRASSASILSFLFVITLIATAILGFTWWGAQDELDLIRSDYSVYQAIARNAATSLEWQTVGKVYDWQEFEDTGKYRILYEFDTPKGKVDNGYSYFVYTWEQVIDMKRDGVVLALDDKLVNTNTNSDSVPLDFKDAIMEEDAGYIDTINKINGTRLGTFIMAGISALLIVSYVLINATAKKATAEQIAADKQGTTATTDSKAAPAGTWRCEYCGVLNDNGKERCDGCGAKRQK